MVSSYTPLALEYYDPQLHPTCANLGELSHLFLAKHIKLMASCQRVLEIGAGASRVAVLFNASKQALRRIEITDASAEMLTHSQIWKQHGASVYVADALALPHSDSSIDCIVASLIDPYNTSKLWSSLERVLTKDGHIIVTTPSHEWAKRFRSSKDTDTNARPMDMAEFSLTDGRTVRVPSYIYPLAETVKMIENTNLSVVHFESLGLLDLKQTNLSPKSRVFHGLNSSLLWGFVIARLS